MRARMMWMLVLAVAVVTVACGDSKSSLLPTAPSALSAETAGVDASTASGEYGTAAKPGNGNGGGNGNGNGNSNGSGNGNGNGNENGGGNGNGNGGGNNNGGGNGRTPGNTSPAPTSPVPPGKAKVEFQGVLQFADATSIKVNGQTVKLTAQTVIRHGNRTVPVSDLSQGDQVHVRANRVESGLEATLILMQKPGDAVVDVLPAPAVEPDVLVSVTASDASMFEVGAAGVDGGMFQLTRTGTATQLAASLEVSFALGGTATEDDYAPVALTATFAPYQTTVDVMVTPSADGVPESPESVVLTLAAGAGYELGSPASASATLADAAPPQVNVVATDADAEEINFNTGRLQVSRTGDLSVPLTVTLQFSGTAQFNVDYRLSPMPPASTFTFTFGMNQAVLMLTVQPINDVIAETEAESVVLSAAPSAAYESGTSGTVTIRAR